MNAPLLLLAAIAALLPVLGAQVQIAVRTVNESGIVLGFQDGSRRVQTFPAAMPFATGGQLTLVEGSPLPLFPGSARMDLGVSPPNPMALPGPLAGVLDRVAIANSARVTDGAAPSALHTTDNAAGAPGTQRYDVVLTGNTQALVTLRLTASVYDHASFTLRVVGGGIDRTWSANSPGPLNDVLQATVPVNGTATLRIEVTTTVTPGPGALLWDGYDSSLWIDAYDVGRAAFRTFGTGCGGAISGSGVPVVNREYTVNLDNAPANTLAMLVFGDSRTSFGFLPLPIPLAYMGAPGCSLNVAPGATVSRTTDAAGHADARFFLPRFPPLRTLYLQWAVLDPAANAAGLSTTQGAELLW